LYQYSRKHACCSRSAGSPYAAVAVWRHLGPTGTQNIVVFRNLAALFCYNINKFTYLIPSGLPSKI